MSTIYLLDSNIPVAACIFSRVVDRELPGMRTPSLTDNPGMLLINCDSGNPAMLRTAGPTVPRSGPEH